MDAAEGSGGGSGAGSPATAVPVPAAAPQPSPAPPAGDARGRAAASAGCAAPTTAPADGRGVWEDGAGLRPLGLFARTAVLGIGLTAFGMGMLGTLSGAAALMWLVPRLASGGWTVALGAGAWYVGSVGLLVAGGCIWFAAIRARAPARGAMVAATIGAGLASFPGLVWLAFVARHLLRGHSLPTAAAPGGLHDTLSFALPVLLAAAQGAALLALGRRLPRFGPGSARRLAWAWGTIALVMLGVVGYVGFPRMLGPAPSAPTAEECNTILLDEHGVGGRWANLIVEWKDGIEWVAPEAKAIELQPWASWSALGHRARLAEGSEAMVPGLITALRPTIMGLPRLDMSDDRALSALARAGPAGRAAIPVLTDLVESRNGWTPEYLGAIANLGLDEDTPGAGRCVEAVQMCAGAGSWQGRLQALSTLVRIGPRPEAERARDALLAHAMDGDERGLRHGWAMDYLLETCQDDPWLVEQLVRVAEAHLDAARPFPLLGGRPCAPAPGAGAPCQTHLWSALQRCATDVRVSALLERTLSSPHPGARACAAQILGHVNCATPELERALDRALADADPVSPSFAAVAFSEQHVCAPSRMPSVVVALGRMVNAPDLPADGVVQSLRAAVTAEARRVETIGRLATACLESADVATRMAAVRILVWVIRVRRSGLRLGTWGDRGALAWELRSLYVSEEPDLVAEARASLLDLALAWPGPDDSHVVALDGLVRAEGGARDPVVLARLIAVVGAHADEAYPAGFSAVWSCGAPRPAGGPCLRCIWNRLERAGTDPSVADFFVRALDSPHATVRARAAEALAELDGATPELAAGLERALAGPDPVAQVFAAARLVFRERVGVRGPAVVRALARLADRPEAGPKLLDSMRTAVRLKERVMARIGAITRECLESTDAITQAAATALAAWLWASDRVEPPAAAPAEGPR